MKYVWLLSPICLLLFSYDSWSNGYKYNYNNAYYSNVDQREYKPNTATQSDPEMDKSIERKVRQEIMKDDRFAGYLKNLQINVEDGIVTIRGDIKTREERLQLANKVRKIDGVKSFNDQLRVTEEEGNA